MPHYPDQILARSDNGTAAQTEGLPSYQPSAAVRLVRDGPVPVASCPHCGGGLDLSTPGVRWQVRRAEDVGNRLTLQLTTLEREELHVLLLNTRNVVLDQERVYQGNVSGAVVRIGELFKRAVERHASSIILCHNHPSGDLQPSSGDLRLTNDAIRVGQLLDIPVLDHLIVGGGTFTSLRAHGVSFEETPAPRSFGERRQPSGHPPHGWQGQRLRLAQVEKPKPDEPPTNHLRREHRTAQPRFHSRGLAADQPTPVMSSQDHG
jgi:hypothetical protein